MTDAGYPKLGFCVAWNDSERGVLELESYAASASARGEATRFRVVSLPDAAAVRVRRDGHEHGDWRATGPDAIEIGTSVGSHRYEIFTGHRGAEAARSGPSPWTASATSRPVARASALEIASALATVGSGATTCPCCAGGGG